MRDHSNAKDAHDLLIDELVRLLEEQTVCSTRTRDQINHVTRPSHTAHPKDCAICTKLALKLQSQQAQIQRFGLSLTKAIAAHYPRPTRLAKPR
jgi:hypothetical protein